MAALAVTSMWDPAVAFDEDLGGETLGGLLGRRASSRGAAVFAESARDDRVLTYGDLERWRAAFAEGPSVPGSTVALAIADPLHFAAALLGAVGAGLWVAPLDPATPDEGPSGLAALTT